MSNQKGFTTIVIVIILAVIAVGGYLMFRTPAPVVENILPSPSASTSLPTGSPTATPTIYPSPVAPYVSVDTSQWKTHQSAMFSLRYPPVLSLRSKKGMLTIEHSVPYRYYEPCSQRGGGAPYEELTDFDVSFEYYPDISLEDAFAPDNHYIYEEFWKDGALTLSPGFIDEFQVGSLKGYRITGGVEGCGRYEYYFPISSSSTLVVKRAIIAEFSRVATLEYQKYLKVPGIIRPEDEEKIFIGILSTFRITK